LITAYDLINVNGYFKHGLNINKTKQILIDVNRGEERNEQQGLLDSKKNTANHQTEQIQHKSLSQSS
jgi:hypothetical protein